jgi:predicted molibdopterin-dependent oxidoreductase YjgC
MTITDMIPAMLDGKSERAFRDRRKPETERPGLEPPEQAMKKLEFLVVQELFLSETAQVADVVFSAASVAEKEGTVTNTRTPLHANSQSHKPHRQHPARLGNHRRLSTAMGYEMHL